MRKFFVILTIAAVLTASAHAETTQITGRASVIDGDTLEIHGHRIRLAGTDAPEAAQICKNNAGNSWRCGQQAALQLADFIAVRPVSCEIFKRDQYRRLIARCITNGQDLAEWLIRNGWGVRYYDKFGIYAMAQKHAKRNRLGIWSGQFDMPKNWRRNNPR